ncbi:hypothetical protein AR457_39975 [Streptomyces agglomeratus]|uniref:hypothetical protein n=1 Tax=Streptomyces agglomeratus TaxID=285458 RepID=UPI0008528864|nr:hypothetical protein [Streptomyces agglomeratus]OEJ21872.1 hypothetical protein AR457_38655 [Streptomyces agglomeratus]OEJ22073.1 hypothetical protein AR457_39975 [Streptomyces agglomeratus]OEJ36910.1 hypothetical protein BGK70_00630 [Streptomyces agglomeratus]
MRSQARRSAPAGRSEAPIATMRRSNPSAPQSPVTNFAIDRAEPREFADSCMWLGRNRHAMSADEVD